MAVEAAVNSLEALVEKVESDLNYAVLKLSNEFSKGFVDGLPSEINPAGLVERLQNAKQDFKMLMKECNETELKKKEILQELSRLTTEQLDKGRELQVNTGIQPNQTSDGEEKTVFEQEKENMSNLQISKVDDISSMSKFGNDSTMCGSTRSDFEPVTEEEFMSVSDLVRGRSKLQDVNKVYECLFTYFQKHRKARCLTLQDMTKLGLKVSGATGSAKLKVYECLFTYFQKHRKARCLTLPEMTKLGLKVSGATGSAKLKVYECLFTYFQKHRKARCLTSQEMIKLGLKVSGATGSAN